MVKSHKTRKTRRHNKSKRKSLRQKRRQTKRKRGGNNNMNINDHCQMYMNKLNEFTNRLQDITLNTYEDLSNDVKNMYDEALRAGCKKEADALELFEDNELYPRIDELQ